MNMTTSGNYRNIYSLLTFIFILALPLPGMAQDSSSEQRTAGKMPGEVVHDSSETYKQLNLFGDVFERVRAQYVDEVEDKKLVETAINGMLMSLDPHSSYINN